MKKISPLTLTALVASVAALPGLMQTGWSPLSIVSHAIVTPAQAAGSKVYKMRVDGMTCPFCAATSEKALQAMPGVSSVSTNLKKGVITVCAAPTAHISASKMKSMFAKKGFTFRSMSIGKSC